MCSLVLIQIAQAISVTLWVFATVHLLWLNSRSTYYILTTTTISAIVAQFDILSSVCIYFTGIAIIMLIAIYKPKKDNLLVGLKFFKFHKEC